jgi:hypothetical protein
VSHSVRRGGAGQGSSRGRALPQKDEPCDTSTVSDWGENLYGNPCHECGFGWAISRDEAIKSVVSTPRSYAQVLADADADGSERDPELTWSVGAYICHVGDNLRIWAERLEGVCRGASPMVASYDEGLLAVARAYEGIAIEAAMWSLERAVEEWKRAVEEDSAAGLVLVHPDRGQQSLLDVVRSNAHDAFHHQWDIERAIRAGSRS